MLNLNAARSKVMAEWLPVFEEDWGAPGVLAEAESDEYEWGWLFVFRPREPSSVPDSRDPWKVGRVLLDRATGRVDLVGSIGIRAAIMRLLMARPPELRGELVRSRPHGAGTEFRISERAFQPKRLGR